MSREGILAKLKPMTNEKWKWFGYESDESCCVCGKVGECKSEPRFNYVVCQEHANITPIETNEFRD